MLIAFHRQTNLLRPCKGEALEFEEWSQAVLALTESQGRKPSTNRRDIQKQGTPMFDSHFFEFYVWFYNTIILQLLMHCGHTSITNTTLATDSVNLLLTVYISQASHPNTSCTQAVSQDQHACDTTLVIWY